VAVRRYRIVGANLEPIERLSAPQRDVGQAVSAQLAALQSDRSACLQFVEQRTATRRRRLVINTPHEGSCNNHPQGDDDAGPHRPLVYLLGTCGLRFGEVAELRRRDIDLDARSLRITRSVALVDGAFEVGSPKSGTGRTVSVPAFVVGLLTAGEPDALVFPDSQGGLMRGSNVRRRWWSQAVSAAKLFPRTELNAAREPVTVYDLKLHELRHTAASLAIQAGANIKALQNMLGHESAGLILDRYGHLYGSDVEVVGIAINALLTRNCGQNVGTNIRMGAAERLDQPA
jgi:integrase